MADKTTYVNPAPWHFGKKVVPGGKKRPWWINRWVTHPCADLALAFEVGARAAHA